MWGQEERVCRVKGHSCHILCGLPGASAAQAFAVFLGIPPAPGLGGGKIPAAFVASIAVHTHTARHPAVAGDATRDITRVTARDISDPPAPAPLATSCLASAPLAASCLATSCLAASCITSHLYAHFLFGRIRRTGSRVTIVMPD